VTSIMMIVRLGVIVNGRMMAYWPVASDSLNLNAALRLRLASRSRSHCSLSTGNGIRVIRLGDHDGLGPVIRVIISDHHHDANDAIMIQVPPSVSSANELRPLPPGPPRRPVSDTGPAFKLPVPTTRRHFKSSLSFFANVFTVTKPLGRFTAGDS
jgi:hypothetical protein